VVIVPGVLPVVTVRGRGPVFSFGRRVQLSGPAFTQSDCCEAWPAPSASGEMPGPAAAAVTAAVGQHGHRRYCAGVDDDRLPAGAGPLISEDLRQRGIDVLQELLASGKVDLGRFQAALDGLLGARTHADFASVVRSLPPPVAFTPAARRRQEPLKISAPMSDVRLKGRWQAGRLTKISTGMGSVTIDLTEAEFDDWDVKIVVDTGMGSVTVIAPRGLDVRQVDRSAAVKSTLEEPIPGFPVVRLSASCNVGTIRLMHPKEKRQRRWGWRRRRSRAAPRS
jgi:hypothetical protein